MLIRLISISILALAFASALTDLQNHTDPQFQDTDPQKYQDIAYLQYVDIDSQDLDTDLLDYGTDPQDHDTNIPLSDPCQKLLDKIRKEFEDEYPAEENLARTLEVYSCNF